MNRMNRMKKVGTEGRGQREKKKVRRLEVERVSY